VGHSVVRPTSCTLNLISLGGGRSFFRHGSSFLCNIPIISSISTILAVENGGREGQITAFAPQPQFMVVSAPHILPSCFIPPSEQFKLRASLFPWCKFRLLLLYALSIFPLLITLTSAINQAQNDPKFKYCQWNDKQGSSIITSISHRPDDGGSKHLWNVGQFLRDYTESTSQKTVIFIPALLCKDWGKPRITYQDCRSRAGISRIPGRSANLYTARLLICGGRNKVSGTALPHWAFRVPWT
jgi:hypothetical protein